MRGLLLGLTPALVFAGVASAADLPVKAPPPAATTDWTGYYVGIHFGYGAGLSRFSANQGGGTPDASGTLDMFNSYNVFTGTGSYLLGFQGGYNFMLPSRLVIGAEA